MSLSRLLRLVVAVLVLAIGVYLIYYASQKTYEAYPTPDAADCRKVRDADATEKSHFEIANMASFDGITRHPTCEEKIERAIEEREAAEGEDLDLYPIPSPWSLVLKDAKSACES